MDSVHRPATEVVVVMLPFVAHGHLNQFAYLSRLISTYNIPVHFVSTTTHIRQLRSRLHRSDQLPIHFHELPIPPFTSPPPHHSNRFPSHLQPAFESTLHLRHPFTNLVLSLSTSTAGRVAVVHDFMMSYVVQDVVNQIPNVETYIFSALSAFDSFCATWKRTGKQFPADLNGLPSQDGCLSPEFQEFVKLQLVHDGFHVGTLFDSSRAIEGEYIEYLEKEEEMKNEKNKKKLWAVGPINSGVTVSENRHECLQWLDLQPPGSVIYVSFGTTTTFSDDQIKELAIGLERSQQRFVWVARVADKGDVFVDETNKMIELPNGFEERVEGRGLVVRGWAPQMAILGHSATGGFMSHCGWNSTMESISMGVPMATWPMHSDQPRNAFFITQVLRIGLMVVDWGRRDELVTAMVVEDIIRRLMDSREGEEIRKRAVEVGGTIRRSAADGGVSRKETDAFVSYLRRPK